VVLGLLLPLFSPSPLDRCEQWPSQDGQTLPTPDVGAMLLLAVP
jgi:hypothetical protein